MRMTRNSDSSRRNGWNKSWTIGLLPSNPLSYNCIFWYELLLVFFLLLGNDLMRKELLNTESRSKSIRPRSRFQALRSSEKSHSRQHLVLFGFGKLKISFIINDGIIYLEQSDSPLLPNEAPALRQMDRNPELFRKFPLVIGNKVILFFK